MAKSTQRALYTGRMQKISEGRIDDFMNAFYLACNPDAARVIIHNSDDSLRVLINEQHRVAKEVMDQLNFLGNLDSLVIGIGGADPVHVEPEISTSENADTRERFFNPEKNPATYFQRMIRLKQLLLDKGLPAERFDFLPHFPTEMYQAETANAFNIPPQELAFRYLGVEKDRDFNRIIKEGSKPNAPPFIYHDFREHSQLVAGRDIPVYVDFKGVDNVPFNVYAKRFIVQEDGTFGSTVERSLEAMFEDSTRTEKDSVLLMVCFPRQSDRDAAAQRWKRPYEEVMKLTPFETYMKIKDYLVRQGVDLRKTHIVPMPADVVLGVPREQSRSESYLPGKYIFFTEPRNDGGVTDVKNQRMSTHPNCQETRHTC